VAQPLNYARFQVGTLQIEVLTLHLLAQSELESQYKYSNINNKVLQHNENVKHEALNFHQNSNDYT